MEQENITEKLIQYIDGVLPDDEHVRIQKWIHENEDIKATYDQLKDVLNSMEQDNASVPSDRMSNRFNAWLDTQSKPQVKSIEFKLFYKVAAAILFLLMSGIGIYTYRSFAKQNAELAAIKLELENTKQSVITGLANQSSASQRLNAVYTSNELTSLDPDLMAALFKTLNTDPNSNVRMASLDALSKNYKQPEVRSALIESMKYQKDPVVQIALIQLLVQMKEKSILGDLQIMTTQPGLLKAVKDEAYKGIFKLT